MLASINHLINIRMSNYNLQGVNVLSLPKVDSTKYSLKCYYAAKQWNALPDNIRTLARTKDALGKAKSLKWYYDQKKSLSFFFRFENYVY